MVKVNLQNNKSHEPDAPNETEIDEVAALPEVSDASEPDTEITVKKGGLFKYILLIFIALIATGSAYFLYTEGWSFKNVSFDSVKSLIVSDDTSDKSSMDESPKKKTTVKKKKRAKKKLSTIKPVDSNVKKGEPKSKPKKKIKTRGKKKVAKPSGLVVANAADGRNLLEVLNSIVTSLGEDSGDLKLAVSSSKVTLAINLNSRADAALLLKKIRQKWPLSNLRAVRFDKSNDQSAYNYATQFDGSIKNRKGTTAKTGGNRRTMNLDDFKNLLSGYLTKSGMTLSNLEASKGVKGKSGTVIPMVITADGANESIVLFMEYLMKSDVLYTVSRASVLSKDDAISKMSIFLSLNIGSNKARS